MGARHKQLILAVDDESANLAMLHRILSPDYAMITAKFGKDALKLAAIQKPDLILLDILMPDMDGFAVLRELQASPETSDIPVIFITGLDNVDDEEQGFTLGAVDYIKKPFKAVVVKARVNTHLKNVNRLYMVKDDLVRISSIVESSPHMMLYINAEGTIEYMNPGTKALSGYTWEELSDKGLPVFLAEDDQCKLHDEYLPRVLDQGQSTFDLSITRKDGKERILSVAAFAAQLRGGETGIGLTASDETDLKIMQQAVLEAKEETERALRLTTHYNKAKSNFLSRMSHEMLTPMNAVIGMSEIIRITEDKDRKRYCLDMLEESSRHMLQIIHAMLDMAEIDTGDFVLNPRKFYLSAILCSAADAIAPSAEAKLQEFTCEIIGYIPGLIIADDRRIRQILDNLLDNAVRFTPTKGSICLSISKVDEDETGGTIRFEVSDSGVGVAPEQMDRLWDIFEQADSSITRIHGGLGLGLAISKRLVEKMGGAIWVESEPGKGSRFIFTIRVEKSSGQAGVSEKADPGAREIASKSWPAEKKTPYAHACYSDFASTADFSGRRILIVDDIAINREILGALLEHTGAVLEYAESGAEAVSKFTSDSGYDLILMDLHMPGMNGFEATQRIRASDASRAQSVPIIAVTADTGAETIHHCLEVGINAHTGKPYMFAQLKGLIAKYLNKASPKK